MPGGGRSGVWPHRIQSQLPPYTIGVKREIAMGGTARVSGQWSDLHSGAGRTGVHLPGEGSSHQADTSSRICPPGHDPTPVPLPPPPSCGHLPRQRVHAPTLLVGGGQRVDSSGSISNHLEQKVKPDESGRDIYVVGADRASVWASGGVAGVESGAV